MKPTELRRRLQTLDGLIVAIEQQVISAPSIFQFLRERRYQAFCCLRNGRIASQEEIEAINRGHTTLFLLPNARLVIVPNIMTTSEAREVFRELVCIINSFTGEGRLGALRENWKRLPSVFGNRLEDEKLTVPLNEQINALLRKHDILP